MIEIIAWTLLGIAALGFLSAIALLSAFIAGNRSDNDLYLTDYDCPCYACSRFEPVDACSSECDKECADNAHYPGQDWRR